MKRLFSFTFTATAELSKTKLGCPGRKEGSKQQNRTASMCVGSDGGGGVGGLQTEKETSGKKKEEV